MYGSRCFGRPHAHHQELNNCSSSLWFYRRSLVIAVLLVVVGPAVYKINPLKAELNPICHLLALLGAHLILHFSRIRVNILFYNANKNSDKICYFTEIFKK